MKKKFKKLTRKKKQEKTRKNKKRVKRLTLSVRKINFIYKHTDTQIDRHTDRHIDKHTRTGRQTSLHNSINLKKFRKFS